MCDCSYARVKERYSSVWKEGKCLSDVSLHRVMLVEGDALRRCFEKAKSIESRFSSKSCACDSVLKDLGDWHLSRGNSPSSEYMKGMDIS